MIFHCAQLSHPSTHWQVFFTRPTSDCFVIDFPGRAISPGEGLLFPSLHRHTFSPKGVAGLSFTARIEGAPSDCAASASKKVGLAAPYPTLLRPRVARAQKIIRLHPIRCWHCRGKKILLFERGCYFRRTRASFTRGPGGLEDGWSSEAVRVMPFYCGK